MPKIPRIAGNSSISGNFEIGSGEQYQTRFLLGLLEIPATTGRFLAGHRRGFVRGLEGVLPLTWPELRWPEEAGLM